MEKCKESPKQMEAKVTSEIKQFQALGAWCTPEFLIQASQSWQTTERVGEIPPERMSAATGRYLASRAPLVAADQINRIMDEMQHLLRSNEDALDSANRDELLQMWMSVEPCLTKEQHRRIFPAVLDRLFPGNRPPHDLCEERTAQKGGY